MLAELGVKAEIKATQLQPTGCHLETHEIRENWSSGENAVIEQLEPDQESHSWKVARKSGNRGLKNGAASGFLAIICAWVIFIPLVITHMR